MVMRTRLTAAVLAALALTTIGPTTAAQAMPTGIGMQQPDAQRFYWEWSDGVDSNVRTFRQSEYKVAENLPQLLVFAEPAKPQQYVKLQYKQNGTWKREDAALTSAKGRAALSLNPYCDTGKWCNGTYKYRLLVNGRYSNFTISYQR